MGFREFFIPMVLVIGCVNAQSLTNVCVLNDLIRCQNLNAAGSQVACVNLATNVECAAQIQRGNAQLGVFSEEELLLLGFMSPNDYRVIGTIRDANRLEPYAFEAVAVVPNNHTNGFQGLAGGRFCHPGLGASDIRWSPRVLRALEERALASRTNVPRCPTNPGSRTAEELEVEALSNLFSEACRPGPWSHNDTVDADLKRRFPNLCAMCSAPGVCAGYDTQNFINIAGVSNSDTHIQALTCLTNNGTATYVAWTHVRQYFMNSRPDIILNYSLLCDNGTLAPLTPEALSSSVSPCAIVRQPLRAIVASAAVAETLTTSLRSWYPEGVDPGSVDWQSNLFSVLAGGSGSSAARAEFLETLEDPFTFASRIRPIPAIGDSGCLPSRRWCTTSAAELDNCNWVRAAAYSLGVQPTIACVQRSSVFDCLRDIREGQADFFSLDSHYGYLARRHFRLSPVKLVRNVRGTTSRVATLVKDSANTNITRFENLRDKVACFPEYGGISYVAFVRIAQERGIISSTECDYARAVGEFFSSSCAPGALDASHSINEGSSFNATTLCTACRPRPEGNLVMNGTFTCAWNFTNLFYGNNGSLSCLSDPGTDVAFVEVQNIRAQLQALGLGDGSSFRALCANNSLAVTTGVDVIDDDCLIAHVVDAEVLTRRGDAVFNSINTLLDSLDKYFGYNVPPSQQLIHLRLYSPFLNTFDLLFKDSTIGLTEPTAQSGDPIARNYIELFKHLEACTSSAPSTTTPGTPGGAGRTLTSFITLVFMGFIAHIVGY